MLQISKRDIMNISLAFYVLFAALCLNKYKAICFIMFMILGIGTIVYFIKKVNIITFYGLWFPIVIIIISTMISMDLITSVKSTYCCFLLLMVLIIKKNKLEYERFFYAACWLLAIMTISIFILDWLGIADINMVNPVRMFIYNNDMGLMGKSETYYFYYSIFLYASPIMVFLLLKKTEQNKWWQVLLILLAIMLTGTRAPFFLSIGGVLIFYFVLRKNSNKRLIFILGMLFGVVVLVCYGKELCEKVYDIVFNLGSLSNNTRVKHLESLTKLFKTHPEYLLWGSGMGSDFYTTGFNKMTNTIELSYINLIRQMGIPMFLVYLYFLIYPLTRIKKNDPNFISYIIYLIIAGLNPYLFDSTAYLVYVYIYTKYVVMKSE